MNSNIKITESFITIGGHKVYNLCRFCKKSELSKVIDIGMVPLAGGFVKKSNINNTQQLYYPLSLGFCQNCKMLQTIETVGESTLFENYYYATSKIKTLANHFEELADEITDSLSNKKGLVVEIGSNDGVLIRKLVKNGVKSLGVDPAINIVMPQIKKGVPLICEYFDLSVATMLSKKFGKADVITSSNTMAHIEDIESVYRGIKKLLKKSGYAIVEVHYLQNLIQEFQYDMIYHEHLYYYSVLSMQNILRLFGLEIYDVKKTSIHAGSIRFYIQHENGPRKISRNVKLFFDEERKQNLHDLKTFVKFNESIKRKKKLLLGKLSSLKRQSKSIAGYGASGRANTIMGYCNIGKETLDYIIDDSPLKQGAYTPGNNLKIVDSSILTTKKRPDYLLLFAWSFHDEIVTKNAKYLQLGGKFLLPLPRVKTVK